MLKHFITLLLIYLPISSFIYSQDFLPNTKYSKSQDKGDLIQLERTFLEWAEGKDLSQTKGWKWYRRWLDEQIQRSSFSGQLPNHGALFKAGRKLTEKKMRANVSRGAGNWIPIGPSLYPETEGTNILKGLGRINTVAFHPTDTNTFWVGVAQGGVWKTTNSGKSWRPLTDDLPILRISDIAVDPNNPDFMYISVGDYAYVGVGLELDERKRHTHYGLGVYRTKDGGQTWNPTGLMFDQLDGDASLTRRVFVNPANSSELVAAGIEGMWRSNDWGETWNKTLDDTMMDLEQDPTNTDILYAVSGAIRNFDEGHANIWKSEDFGDSWIELPSKIPGRDSVRRVEIAIAPSNPNYIYAVASRPNGGFFGFYQSTDGGHIWELKSKSPNILNWSYWNFTGGQGNYDLAITVHPQDPEVVYVGGVNMWGTTDGGSTWNGASYYLPSFGPSIHADHHFYKYNPLDGFLYVCHDGGISRTLKPGLAPVEHVLGIENFQWETHWEHISSGMQITSFYRMGFSSENKHRLIAGAQDNSVILKTEEGWKALILGDGMESFFHPDDEDVMFFSTQYGRFARSDDGGETVVDNLSFPTLGNELSEWTTPFMAGPEGGDHIYAAFNNIWKSDDRGDTWERISDLPGPEEGFFPAPASTMSIAPSDANTIYVGKRIYPTFDVRATFWRTTNGGEEMIDITQGLPDTLYFTSSTVDNQNSQQVWVTVGGFVDGAKVFFSSDGGDNWKNISNNLPNIPVNVISHQPFSNNNTIYIGTDLGVYYYNDDTEVWTFYSHGLPNVIVSDLDIDIARNKIYAATFGRGLWAGDLINANPAAKIPIREAEINLFPNPNRGSFQLTITHPELAEVEIQVVDILGRSLHSETLIFSDKTIDKNFELGLLPGLYFIRISKGNYGKVVKFQVSSD